KLPNSFQPLHWRRSSGLHRARQHPVQRRDRKGNLCEAALGHARQYVDVARHQGRLGDDTDRMTARLQNLQYIAHDAPTPFHRLVGVRIGTNCNGARLITFLGQLPFQQFCRVRLGEQLRFEIQSWRKAHEGMARTREAVDAAMLATTIGIDRAVERDIRRFISRYDGAGPLHLHFRLKWRKIFKRIPAVIEYVTGYRLEPSRRIDASRATTATLR